jgi:hypothetical protein
MNDPRIRRNPLGFHELIEKPSEQDLAAYYRDVYYQCE